MWSEGPAKITARRQETHLRAGRCWVTRGLSGPDRAGWATGANGRLGNQDEFRLLGEVGPREGGLGQQQAGPDGGVRCHMQGLGLHGQEEQTQPQT